MPSKYEKDVTLVIDDFLKKGRYHTPAETLCDKIKNYAASLSPENSQSKYISKYPMFITWKINSNCNLHCKHCYFRGESYSAQNDLSTKTIMKIIDQLADIDILHIRITGGEVFLRKDIIDIIKHTKGYGIILGATTNATTITPQLADELANILNHNDYINVSLDGADAKTHDHIRGQGAFDKTINAIKLLRNRDITVTVNSTITTHNCHQLFDLYMLANELDIKNIMLMKIIPTIEEHDELIPDYKELISSYANVLNKKQGDEKTFLETKLFQVYDFAHDDISREIFYNKVKNKPGYKDFNYETICHGNEIAHIDNEGKVYLCHIAANHKLFPIGDLTQDNFINIWGGSYKNELFIKRNLNGTACKICTLWPICQAKCPVTAYKKYGTVNGPDGNCKLALLKKEWN